MVESDGGAVIITSRALSRTSATSSIFLAKERTCRNMAVRMESIHSCRLGMIKKEKREKR
jgi:hypothetical protein